MSDKIDFKMSLTAGLIPFIPMKIVYVGDANDTSFKNYQEEMDVERRRHRYTNHLIDLGVSPDDPNWNRLVYPDKPNRHENTLQLHTEKGLQPKR